MPRVPRLLSGPNVRSLNLSSAESYLLSRVDGVLNEEDLAFVTGMGPDEATEVLERLALLGAVDLGGAPLPPPPTEAPRPPVAPSSAAAQAAGEALPYDPAELDEPVELEPDRRRRVLDLYYRLDELTYYELLGIGTDAEKKQIKSAYYAVAPDFHPDKYFRRQLGSYKSKIEAIFGRITLAHDVLTSPQKRAEYDDYLVQTHKNRATSAVLDQTKQDVAAILAAVERAAAQAVAAQATQPAAPQTTARTPDRGQRPVVALPPQAAQSPQDVLRQRREALARKLTGGGPRRPAAPAPYQSSPEMDAMVAERTAEALRQRQEIAVAEAKTAQVNRYVEAGRAALESQDYAGAANSYRIAASLAPDDAGVQTACNAALQAVAVALADGYWKQAVYEESQERWAEAALSYSKVCTGKPDSAQAHERVAYTTLKSSANARRAVEFARRAIELDPKKPEFRVTLARTYAAAGLEKSAQSELDRALELAPKDARVQALVTTTRAALAPKKKEDEEGPPAPKASGFHNFVAAVRSAIAPKESK
jgi:tetratricopeptide (TPR) repeat protein